MKLISTFVLVLLSNYYLKGTNIKPYLDIHTLYQKSQFVVYGKALDTLSIEILKSYKGDLGGSVQIFSYGSSFAYILGDVNLKKDQKYLLFLDKNKKPICLSYYILEDRGKFFYPTEKAFEIETPFSNKLGYYSKEELISALDSWSVGLKSVPPIPRYITKRESPDQCSYSIIYEDYILRVKKMPLTLFSNRNDLTVPQAINNVNQSFESVSILYGGILDYQVNCSDGSAAGPLDYASYLSYLDWLANPTSSAELPRGGRTGIVFFDDPCSELMDLDNCGGILALGGAYCYQGAYHIGDKHYANAAYPFVILNNNLSNCYGDQISLIITKEIIHSLGIKNIPASFGMANLNPECCNEITPLDIECVSYLYNSSQGEPIPCPCGCPSSSPVIWTGGGFFKNQRSAPDPDNNWNGYYNWDVGFIPSVCSDVYLGPYSVVGVFSGDTARARTLEIDSMVLFQVDLGAVLEIK